MKEHIEGGLPEEAPKTDKAREHAVKRLIEVEEMIRVTEESMRRIESRTATFEGEANHDNEAHVEAIGEQERVMQELALRMNQYQEEKQRHELLIRLIDSNVETRKRITELLRDMPIDPEMPN